MMERQFEAHSPSYAQLESVQLAYDAFGEPGAPALLLISGLGNTHNAWHESFCMQLVERGYYVIRFANRDAGLSTRVAGGQTPSLPALVWALLRGKTPAVPYRADDMAQDAAGLLDHLGVERAHIVGASLGGVIGQQFALRYPQRALSLTSMMSTSGNPWLPLPRRRSLVLFESSPAELDAYIEHSVKVRRGLRGYGYPFDEAFARQQAESAFHASPQPPGVQRQMAALLATLADRDRLAAIRVPTLVIHGGDDPLLPVRHGVDTAKRISGARLLVVRGMGHELPPVLWPQVIAAIDEHARGQAKGAQ